MEAMLQRGMLAFSVVGNDVEVVVTYFNVPLQHTHINLIFV